eukprot:TRINITY_DN1233_c2_g1_i1.p1 TRINITY_DN1233_c2_g1~~TRINITY_DN1233_c2_g1_i1.p1  ORF type:complete len:780 (+),score=203.52 TRINITY_DN1233_c2_g1_i1:402-2741(+)
MAAPDFSDLEALDGVRLSWNVWPNSKVEATKCVIPFGALYTPQKAIEQMPVVPYEPVRCKACRAVLNPFARVDFNGKIWICPFCYQRNHFPPHYASISEVNLPAELFPQYTTMEYTLPSINPGPPVFLFVLDTCLIEEELAFLKTAISQAIGLLPPAALVGLLTFGTQVHVHELGFSECPKMFIFRGSKEVSRQQILEQLGLAGPAGAGVQRGAVQPQGGSGEGVQASSITRFLLPATECEFTLASVLDELQRDAFPVQPEQRAARCTGTALSVAAGLLGTCVSGTGARILTFVGGPCTEGPGTIVSRDLSEPIRSHKDLDKDTVPHYSRAVKFYEGLAKQLVTQGHVLDVFASALDQVGVAEMKVAIERTGGLVVLAESFGHPVFKDSLKRIFETGEHALGLSFNGIFEVNCSRDIKVQGSVGPCASLDRKSLFVSETVVGQGGTTAWKLCGLDASTSLALFFEIVPTTQQQQQQQQQQQLNPSLQNPASQQLFLQFLTQYQHPNGETRLRSTTITRRWTDGAANVQELVAGFDQEASAVLVARLATFKMETEEEFDATRWLDRMLIRVSSRFGDYRKDDPSSFNFQPNFSIFPQFMFNLRRSQFVQVFNNSPDETAYFRMVLTRENVLSSLVMIQPPLIAYTFNSEPEPALLDVAAIAPDRILLLDAYFSVVIFHGMTIAQWRNEGYHKQPEYAAFASLLQQPQQDAAAIVRDRFPVPRLVDCDQHGSQARFLLAKLNPSATYNSATGSAPGGEVILTDDVSLQVFMEHLQRLAVQS